ncbi:MAG TPA: histidine phosphatase family protein [Woeseiaceae bacterium]|nr:histidine phosphatase family protein [Woeseiaceae bacterium]
MRHGEPVGGVRYRGTADDPLSAKGWAQMEHAVGSCGAFDRIVTSPLRRCADFARSLAWQSGTPLTIEPGFREMHFGEWEGQTPQALMAACPDLLRQFWANPLAHPPPGAEALDAFRARVIAAWRAQLGASEDRTSLAIVHGGTVRAILAHLRHLPEPELACLSVPYASLHKAQVKPGGDRVELACIATGAR